MERRDVLKMMGTLKPAGMRHSYDQVVADATRRRGAAQRVCWRPPQGGDHREACPLHPIKMTIASEPLTIHGDGNGSRSCDYVDDLIEGVLQLMDTGTGFTAPLNVGRPVEFSMRELAHQVSRLLGGTALMEHRPLPYNDPSQRQPDINLARVVLGCEANVPREEGLHKTIAYFRERPKALKSLANA